MTHRGEEIDSGPVETILRSSRAPQAQASEEEGLISFARDGLAAGQTRQELLDQLDRALIAQMLEICSGNQSKAAERLGFNRNTLARRLVELGLK